MFITFVIIKLSKLLRIPDVSCKDPGRSSLVPGMYPTWSSKPGTNTAELGISQRSVLSVTAFQKIVLLNELSRKVTLRI